MVSEAYLIVKVLISILDFDIASVSAEVVHIIQVDMLTLAGWYTAIIESNMLAGIQQSLKTTYWLVYSNPWKQHAGTIYDQGLSLIAYVSDFL